MKFISHIILVCSILLITSCTARHTCNKLLDAAQSGRFYLPLDKPSIHFDYWDLMTYSPDEDTASIESRIYIPQYFDSYEFLAKEDLISDSLHRSVNLNKHLDLSNEGLENFKSVFMGMDNALQLNDSIITYTQAPCPIQVLKYRLNAGSKRYLQVFFCLKTDDGWKVFSSTNQPI